MWVKKATLGIICSEKLKKPHYITDVEKSKSYVNLHSALSHCISKVLRYGCHRN